MSHLPLAAGRVRLGGGFGIRPAACLARVPRSPLTALRRAPARTLPPQALRPRGTWGSKLYSDLA